MASGLDLPKVGLLCFFFFFHKGHVDLTAIEASQNKRRDQKRRKALVNPYGIPEFSFNSFIYWDWD